MKLESICIKKAKRKQSRAGRKRKFSAPPIFQAHAVPIITGTIAPVNVFGRAARIHADRLFVFMLSRSEIIYYSDGKVPMKLV